MTFQKGDAVRLAEAHRGLDGRYTPRSYRPGDRFTVVGCVPGEPYVRVRDAAAVSTLLIPAAKLRPAGRPAEPNDGDHPGGGPVG